MTKALLTWLAALLTSSCLWAAAPSEPFPIPRIPCEPRQYTCLRAASAPVIDGKLDEAAWEGVPWTEPFVDIEGPSHPSPRFATQARLLWDDRCLYIAARLEEPDVWATLTERDCVIFQDNDFEVFIDPDGDTHRYYELEINALGTAWDLLLVKPYRDTDQAAINSWDIHGLKVGVSVDGTLNQPGDRDRGWTVELALPWEALRESAPGGRAPRPGESWRLNFSRVEWQVRREGESYRKVTDPSTGKPLPENNWIWSPQGLVNMHYPEMWGYLHFSDRRPGEVVPPPPPDPEAGARWALRQLYYRQKDFRARTGRWASSLKELGMRETTLPQWVWPPRLVTTPSLYEAVLKPTGGGPPLHITQDGRIWRE